MFREPEQLAQLYKAYDERSNYKVVSGDGPRDTVYVFFSSKGLYDENDYEDFRQKILQKDRYEWERVIGSPQLHKAAGTFILVRDIRMNDWLTGINGVDNTPEKLAQRLRRLTDGKKHCVFCGSSLGGYAALLFGAMLQAERIVVFSPIVDLPAFNRFCESQGAPLSDIRHHDSLLQEPALAAYTSALPYIAEYTGALYWFYPDKFAFDVSQYALASGQEHVRFFSVNRKQHGSTILVESMIRVLCASGDDLDALYRKYQGQSVEPIRFLRDTHGWWGANAILVRRLWRQLRKQLHR